MALPKNMFLIFAVLTEMMLSSLCYGITRSNHNKMFYEEHKLLEDEPQNFKGKYFVINGNIFYPTEKKDSIRVINDAPHKQYIHFFLEKSSVKIEFYDNGHLPSDPGKNCLFCKEKDIQKLSSNTSIMEIKDGQYKNNLLQDEDIILYSKNPLNLMGNVLESKNGNIQLQVHQINFNKTLLKTSKHISIQWRKCDAFCQEAELKRIDIYPEEYKESSQTTLITGEVDFIKPYVNLEIQGAKEICIVFDNNKKQENHKKQSCLLF